MKPSCVSCTIAATNFTSAPLTLEIVLDGETIFTTQSSAAYNFEYEMPTAEGEHCLEFVLHNKTLDHTEVSDAGEILRDSYYEITNLAFDGIELGQLLVDHAVYHHSHNQPAAPVVQDRFYSVIGCNGRVSLQFTTPLYQWLLEHM
jgi:hypothetical protein